MIKIFAFFLCLFVFHPAMAKKNDPIVAKIGNKTIRLSEFKKQYKTTTSAFNRPSTKVFLEDLIRYEMGVLEAKKRKYNNDPLIKERMKQEIYKFLLERELGKKVQRIKVSEKEMRAEYKRSPELSTSHILIEFKPGASKSEKLKAKKAALEVLKKVKTSKKSFEELVQIYSNDSLSKASGGDIGYQSRVTAVPTYYNAARTLKKNKVYSGLVETRFGYHIIKLTGINRYKDADKRQLRQVVFEEKRKRIFNAFFKALKKSYTISVNRGALKGVKF